MNTSSIGLHFTESKCHKRHMDIKFKDLLCDSNISLVPSLSAPVLRRLQYENDVKTSGETGNEDILNIAYFSYLFAVSGRRKEVQFNPFPLFCARKPDYS